ncbi:MAG TPA: hypothetical protein VJT13_14295 [Xanthobacteraceae bacterium]|nr:hypothetical protein [Xanthobacteraceae bacterium]
MTRQGSGASDFVGGLQDAIQKNPVSAALIGMGVLWMFAGGSKITAAAALLPAAAKATAAGTASGLQRSAEIAGDAGENLRSLGASVVEGVRDTVSGAAAAAGETATKAYETVKDTAADSTSRVTAGTSALGGTLQQNLTQTFERQPLLLGAIGLAIGAGMAAALPPTQMETEMVGDTTQRVKAQAAELATTTVDKVAETAERTLDAVKQEAAAQGLTPQAAREGAAAVGAKLKTVAKAAGGQNKAKSMQR